MEAGDGGVLKSHELEETKSSVKNENLWTKIRAGYLSRTSTCDLRYRGRTRRRRPGVRPRLPFTEIVFVFFLLFLYFLLFICFTFPFFLFFFLPYFFFFSFLLFSPFNICLSIYVTRLFFRSPTSARTHTHIFT